MRPALAPHPSPAALEACAPLLCTPRWSEQRCLDWTANLKEVMLDEHVTSKSTDAHLRFSPIDLDAHFEKGLQFIRDAFVCSYGAIDKLDEIGGPEGYRSGLQQALSELPETIVHVWRCEELVGQVELSIHRDRALGFVNLFYLIPAARGCGMGRALHDYARDVFWRNGVSRARLSVAPTNTRALRFYAKRGWRDLGPRQDRPYVHAMELDLT